MKIIFLGTSSMAPTKDRNTSSILLIYEGEYILFDCGEGTQRQLMKANISPTKITKILISHWHGDHVLGLSGLLQTIAASQKKEKIEIYGPKNTNTYLKNLWKSFSPSFNLEFTSKEITKKSTILNEKKFEIHTMPVKHLTHCISFYFKEKDTRKINLNYTKKFNLIKHPLLGKLQQGKPIYYKGHKITPEKATYIKPGKKITYITDTKKIKQLETFAKDSDILIIESTYSQDMKDSAKERGHLTAKQAAEIAKKANVKKLILTHFSQRYKSTKDLEKEAKAIFKNTICAKDFLTIEI
jgi:ribonuclease Z